MDRPATAPFAERLLAWWDEAGRKDLPWQQHRSPYRVWVAEIMLQQTQVATVIPYFERWMARFPDIAALAAAPADEVLAHWSGLGYYARARNLHAAARQCVEQRQGQLPETAAELAALPGIGESTANAIISQASDHPAPVLDGNVRRLLARHAAIEGWPGKSAVQRRLWAEARSRLPATRGADYTQAVMDLGALVCTRSRPDCERCPVGSDCEARRRGLAEQLPTPKPKARVANRAVHMLILRDSAGRVLLERRPPTGIWGGLWCLPEGDSLEAVGSRLGLKDIQADPLPAFEHRLTHLRMTIHPALCTSANPTQVKCDGRQEWFERAIQLRLGLPRPVRNLLARLD